MLPVRPLVTLALVPVAMEQTLDTHARPSLTGGSDLLRLLLAERLRGLLQQRVDCLALRHGNLDGLALRGTGLLLSSFCHAHLRE